MSDSVPSGGTVLRILSPLLVAVFAAILPHTPLGAQETGTTVTLTVGPSFVNFPGAGGHFGAAVARLSVSRDFSRMTGGEISAFALAPLGGASAQPGCPQGTKCLSTSTPNLLSGVLASLFVYAGESPLRMSVGVGAVGASGGEGFENRSSVAGLAGLDWLPRTNSQFAPTLAIRIVQLSSPIAGARTLLLPGLGLSF
jgi:hypothetical protein